MRSRCNQDRFSPAKSARLDGRLIRPPDTGSRTPVVPGAEVGSPRRTRTARYANACASSISPSSPTASTASTGTFDRPASICITVRFRRPPPHTSHRDTGAGKCRAASATQATVSAASVAAPSSVESGATRSRNP